MPVKARRAKARRTDLTHDQWLDLTIGMPADRYPFEDDDDRRAHWEIHRDHLMKINAGKRPDGWWDYESPAPRDHTMVESLQLYRLGELKGEELEMQLMLWREWAEKARRLHYAAAGGRIVPPGPEAEGLWRAWAGIPDELFTESGSR